MNNWEFEFKKYIAKKMQENLGMEINIDDIGDIIVNTNIDYNGIDIEDLATIYAFAIMREDFEMAKRVADEFQNRNCEIKIDVDEGKKTGIINVYLKPNSTISEVEIKMKVTTDGMVIDFESQGF